MKTQTVAFLFILATYSVAERVTVQGTIVDAKSGEVIKRPIIVQAGKFYPENPDKPITWGFSESRSSRRDASFRTSVRWSEGWTARVIVDGYFPEPVLKHDPGTVDGAMEVTLRLRPLPEISGTVLDHKGNPVSGASLYAVGPTGINLHGGQIWQHDKPVEDAEPIMTDAQGRFTGFRVPADGRLAVSCLEIDAWPFTVETFDTNVVLALPEPAGIKIHYGIDGAPETTEVFYQCLNNHLGEPEEVERWKRLTSDRTFEIKQGTTILRTLPPGRYQIARFINLNYGSIGRSLWLDHEFIELKPGEVRILHWQQQGGAKVKATLEWPKDIPVDGISYAIVSKKSGKDFGGLDVVQRADGGMVNLETKAIRTASIAPGSYQLRLTLQKPIPKERLMMSGLIGPDFTLERDFEVPIGSDEIDLGKIVLEGLR